MNLRASIAILLAASFSACINPEPPTTTQVTVTVDSLYALTLPGNLEPGFDMHDYASLQYLDNRKDIYVICIEDAKVNLGEIKRRRLKLEGYYNFVENSVLQRADSALMVAFQARSLDYAVSYRAGDYYALQAHWNRTFELFYRIAVYESKEYFFQLVIWMPFEIHCQEMGRIDSITNSFRVLRDQPPKELSLDE